MTRELNRLTAALLSGFAIIAISAAFWPVIEADDLLARPDNARNVIEAQRIQRGTIYDRDGVELAYSQESDDGIMQRVYPYPAAAVGYYSFTYGAAGVEAAFDADLSGANVRDEWETFVDDTLHQAPTGSDVRTTLDLDVQQQAAAALGARSGAVIAVHVPSGRVLAMVSHPDYDPNRIDRDWERLTQDEATSPLLNRVTAGLYQPGGALQTIMLAALLAAHPDLSAEGGYVLNSEAPHAHDPVQVGDLTLTCLPETPDRLLTMAEAYVFGCPQPFVAALDGTLTPAQIWDRLALLGMLDAPEFVGAETTVGEQPKPLNETTPREQLEGAVVGQGELTVTPLQMAQVVAVIANQGNAVPLHLVDAIREPESEEWKPVPVPVVQPALLRADVAEALRLTMLQAAALSPYVSQARGGLVLYGHSALAFGRPDAAWFAGFVDRTEGENHAAVVVVVVVEDEHDPGVAAAVAGEVFAAAANHTDD